MSLFTKRKGRRISTFDDDEEQSGTSGAPAGEGEPTDPIVQPIRFGKRPLKQSALRRSINIADTEALGADLDESGGSSAATAEEGQHIPTRHGGDSDDEGPVVVRPSIGRSGSKRNKKRLSTASTSSRLSFGVGGGDNDNDDDDSGIPVLATPKRGGTASASSLTQRVLETNAFRKSLSSRLPTRQRPDGEDEETDRHRDNASKGNDDYDDDGRPRYSQAYLEELQSSTPNTPQNLASSRRPAGGNDADLMDLDPSELDGAMVVDSSELAALSSGIALGSVLAPPPIAKVLTATEIQERKDRRARHALEQDAIELGSDNEETGYISLLTDEQKRKKKQKEMTRLVREDEDLGEGFDEFVDDGDMAIGRKAEREARRKRKQEMADLINAAEVGDEEGDTKGGTGGRGESDDDSEAERRAAYDEAQTRAGMDGLYHRLRLGDDDHDAGASGVHGTVPIPRMRALPDLSVCLQQMRGALEALEANVAQHRHKLAEVNKEKEHIAAREKEVQAILDTAAAKYQAVLGKTAQSGTGSNGSNGIGGATLPAAILHTQSPLRPLPPGLAGELPIERGLESLGTTPTRRSNPDDVF